MAHSKTFINELDKLFHARTHWLRSQIRRQKPGKPPSFDGKHLHTSIIQLQKLASQMFVSKLAKSEFKEHAGKKKAWHIKGYGQENQKHNFDRWFKNNFIFSQPCIYFYWRGNKCTYIGKTGSGGSRPSSHLEKRWSLGATRIDIYPVKSKSQLSKLECLAIHWFDPNENKKKASKSKYSKTCPKCKLNSEIRNELKKIFRLR